MIIHMNTTTTPILQGIQNIIYDLDGTIIDTVDLHIKGMEAVGKEFGLKVDLELYKKYYGRKLKEFIAVLFEDKEALERNIDDILKFKRAHFLSHIKEIKIFPGFKETLDELCQRDKQVWICTSAPGIYLDTLIRENQIFQYFKGRATTQEMFVNGKPDPESLELTMKLMGGVSPRECMYIGDAVSDYLAARNASMSFVLYRPEGGRNRDIPEEIPRIQNHRQLLNYL